MERSLGVSMQESTENAVAATQTVQQETGEKRTATEIAERVLRDLIRERLRQDGLWGEQNHGLPRWTVILLEELGEATKAANDAWTAQDEATREMYLGDVRRELIHTAAVAVAMIECLDRIGAAFVDSGLGCLRVQEAQET